MLPKFMPDKSIDARRLDTEVVPKNSVRDKIDMFSKLDVPLSGGYLSKSYSAPAATFGKSQQQLRGIIKNTSSASKNQNKCFIKDINRSISEKTPGHESMLKKIVDEGKLEDATMLMDLEKIVNRFDMSLLFTITGLMNDNAFTLGGQKMKFLHLSTQPSIKHFKNTFDGAKIDSCSMASVDMSVVESNQIQLQMHVQFRETASGETRSKRINVIFMARYDEPSMATQINEATKDTFDVFFTSFFEVTREL
jgi:hypothetical protein